MDIQGVFEVLGIEPVKDEGIIKRAYREKLCMTNPEFNSKGFMCLRRSYEEALRYAHGQDEENTGVDIAGGKAAQNWLKKVSSTYENIHDRINVIKWAEIFDDDAFVSLESGDECRRGFLVFLMQHFRFTKNVWGLIDKRMGILDGEDELKEDFGEEFISFLCVKCRQGEVLDFAGFEGEPAAAYDKYLHYYDICWQALCRRDFKEAEDALEKMNGFNIFHPAAGVCLANLYELKGDRGKAVECILKLKDICPDDTMVLYNAAELLWKYGNRGEAAGIYEKIKKKNNTHYMANKRLAEWYYIIGEPSDAKKCAEKVIARGAGSDFCILFEKINIAVLKQFEHTLKAVKEGRE